MAASVLLIVGPRDGDVQRALLRRVIEKAGAIRPGTGPGQMGPVIDERSLEKITGYIDRAERGQGGTGARILLDGRSWTSETKGGGGNWIGPTIILHESGTDEAMKEEVFGPVLSVKFVSTWQEAIAIENASPFGNAASVYTTNGGHAEWFTRRVRASVSGDRSGGLVTCIGVDCSMFVSSDCQSLL